MKERPIIFSGEMIRAILADRKTQTRRIVKPQPIEIFPFIGRDDKETGDYGWCDHPRVMSKRIRCPYGQPGDRLWVRECFSYLSEDYDDSIAEHVDQLWYWADGNPEHGDWTRPRPSIHMPRWASRITLEIVSVRVQRLQDISEDDAQAEGAPHPTGKHGTYPCPWRNSVPGPTFYQQTFRKLWRTINGKRAPWESNPWVWVIEFRRVVG